MAYCTPDEVLARMGHPAATSADLLARIVDAIPAAQAQIDSDCGRVFTASTATRTFRPMGYSYVLHLPDFTALTTLKVDDDDDGVFETTIAAGGYELDKGTDRTDWPYDRVRLLDRHLPYGGRRQRRIQVAATWGWAAVPSPINQACSLMAARLAQRSKHALFGTESLGDVGAAMIRNNDPDYLRLIGPYRVPQVA
jgi:hypothetical protein